MKFNLRIIGGILGILLIINGIFMLLCLPATIYYHNEVDIVPISFSGCVTLLVGCLLYLFNKNTKDALIRKRDGYLIVTLGWVFMSLSGTLPYVLSGLIPSFTDAFFETMSGYTTTGASIITDIEAMPKDILLWRSMTQWMGGMGIIVLAVAILPVLGIGGMELFVAEAPGISPDKLQPRITETAKRLWLVYVAFTVLEVILLKLGGMSFYDAVNHSLTTMATGGFSTKNASVAYYDSPFIQYTITFFMFLAGTSFTLLYFLAKGKLNKLAQNEEFRSYVAFILLFTVIITVTVFLRTDMSVEQAFRDSLFQVVSIITTTGFVSADYTAWGPFILVLFVMMMFFGGSAGSTAGGVKIVRHIVLAKNTFLEFKRLLHPSAVIPLRLNGRAVNQTVTYNVLAFIIMYIMIFSISSFFMAVFGADDILTAVGSVATCLGNIGPGIGHVGPMDNFASQTVPGKWFLSFLMLVGRLELFTVLILFTPFFWRNK